MAINTLATLRANETDVTMPTILRAYYQRVFLSVTKPKLVHDMLGQKATLPKNTGEQVLWRRWLKLATNTVPLTEGVTPTGKSLTYQHVLATVKWYGDWVEISDVVDFMHPDKVLTMATKRLAIQAAESMDIVTRDVINAGSGVYRVTADGSTPTTGEGDRNTVNGMLTKKVIDTIVTTLKTNDAEPILPKMGASRNIATEPIGAAYVAIIHPQAAQALVHSDSGFGDDYVPVEKYAGGRQAYPSECGKYRNVRFVESTFAKKWADTGGATSVGSTAASKYRSTTGSAGDVYSVLVIAEEAYGVVGMKGASMVYFDKAGGNSDPLHQRNTAAWKRAHAAVILDNDKLVRAECLAPW